MATSTRHNAAMEPTPRQYGQHRREDALTHVLVLTGTRKTGGVQEVLVPIAPALARQRAAINARAYDLGQGRDV